MGEKNSATPNIGFVPPPSAPPSYLQAVGPVSPFTPQQSPSPRQHYVPANNVQHVTQIVTTVVPVGPDCTHMICPTCRSEINTQTTTKPGLVPIISGFIIALVGCFCGCCLIPCCINDCMDVEHRCPNCKAYLGRYRRFEKRGRNGYF